MKKTDQICLHEQAEKLKALGINQESSLFYFVNKWRNPRNEEINNGEHIITDDEMHITTIRGRSRGTEVEFVSAFTVAELGVMLQQGDTGMPVYENKLDTSSDVSIAVSIETWMLPNIFNCRIINKESPPRVYKECKSRYEAHARAELLIYMLKNKLLTAEEANQRL